jgi:hypothetical protein
MAATIDAFTCMAGTWYELLASMIPRSLTVTRIGHPLRGAIPVCPL